MAKPSRAEYMRDYRKTIKPMEQREAYADGFRAGVMACVQTIKLRAGNGALTGYQTARLLETCVQLETWEEKQRKALIQSLQPA